MPEDIRKSFMLLNTKLENLADGARKHAADEGYPTEVVEEKIRTIKTELERAMELWKQTQADASTYKNNYEKLEKEIKDKVAKFNSSVYGHFGKKNAQVKDFGLKPYKEKSAAKTASPATTAPATATA
ncbi:MAG: hypothetical protein V1874_00405 [Spirochaetota bacterium]